MLSHEEAEIVIVVTLWSRKEMAAQTTVNHARDAVSIIAAQQSMGELNVGISTLGWAALNEISVPAQIDTFWIQLSSKPSA